jgi:hypothetical protein
MQLRAVSTVAAFTPVASIALVGVDSMASPVAASVAGFAVLVLEEHDLRIGFGGRWIGPGWRGGWRRGWRRGWGWPVGLGIGLGAWSYYDYPYYSDSCMAWNGYRWVNTCYGYY